MFCIFTLLYFLFPLVTCDNLIMFLLLFFKNINQEFIFFQLGVNGYGFMVDNNGHVLYHPDLRPMVSGSPLPRIKVKVNVVIISIKRRSKSIVNLDNSRLIPQMTLVI